ncbi:MAG: MMPL family transporter [Gemmatimonadota bacterium]
MSWWSAPWSTIGVLLFAAVAGVGVMAAVDLSPQVEGDFFFASDDPQMAASRDVAQSFPAGAQVILRVADELGDEDAYRETIGRLTEDLRVVPGITTGFSIATENAEASPLFGRILLNPDPSATNIILLADDTPPETLLPRVEAVVDRYRGEDVSIVTSGVPVIVELIRRSLYRDLVVFSSAAALVFALLIGIVYRDPAIVLGTLVTCGTSVAMTLLIVQGLGIGIGLLTANLVTIVFVLTLSHIVFMTGNWRARSSSLRAHPKDEARRVEVLRAAVDDTWEASFWSMSTTLLGFASLLVASAQPLRELGLAGVVGSLTALGATYAAYPTFLVRWARPHADPRGPDSGRRLAGRGVLAAAGMGVVIAAIGLPNLQTDPNLLSYFADGSTLKVGLERVDEDGGSSTLDVVVSDAEGRAVSDGDVYPRLEALQDALEADPSVGVVLSPTVLIDHARTIPLAGFLPVSMLLDLAASDQLDNVGLGYVTEDRMRARFSLRMRESVGEPRGEVMERLRARVDETGLEADVIAGLYDLQAQLGTLIRSSLMIGIGGLLLLFLGVAAAVSRSVAIAGLMWVCLGTIPIVILGAFGLAGVAMDIITSPAANIALAIGADSMIHLVVRVRRLRADGVVDVWSRAVAEIGRPVVGASTIIVAGFGIFALSAFPPTQRFGFAVIVGTVTAATMALLVLPGLACLRKPEPGSLSAAS